MLIYSNRNKKKRVSSKNNDKVLPDGQTTIKQFFPVIEKNVSVNTQNVKLNSARKSLLSTVVKNGDSFPFSRPKLVGNWRKRIFIFDGIPVLFKNHDKKFSLKNGRRPFANDKARLIVSINYNIIF